MNANLHLHSRYSDGSSEFAHAAARFGFLTVVGCEVDCQAPEVKYHSEVLAYFPAGHYLATETFLESLARARSERLMAYLECARVLFERDDISFDDLIARKLGERASAVSPFKSTLSKVDFYLYLCACGVIDSSIGYKEFKTDYLESGKIDGPRGIRTTVAELSSVVRRDGGFLVLPHIGHEFSDKAGLLRAEKRRFVSLLEYMKEVGVSGVELYWYRTKDGLDINADVATEAERLGLFVTFGSDCHGPGSGKHTLGEFSGDFPGFPGYPLSPATKE